MAFVDGLPSAVLPIEDWLDVPFTWLGRALDRVALHGMHLSFAPTLFPTREERARVRRSAEPYLSAELRLDPGRFFEFLNHEPRIERVRESRRSLRDGLLFKREFTAAYQPFHAGGGWQSCPENDTIAVHHWTHRPGPPRAIVIALHGFTMGHPRIDARVMMLPRLYAHGFDVVQLTLPFHGCRTPRTARYSGERFGSWDVACLNESVRQAIHDLHVVRTWCRDNVDAPIGLLGLSLGGYLAALAASRFPDWAFVLPLLPPVCLGAIPGRLHRLAGGSPRHVPLSRATLRRAYRIHSPLTYPLATPRERVLIVGARGDQVVPPVHAHRLWRHWQQPAIHWFSGSHVARFQRQRTAERIDEHLQGLGLIDP